VLLVNDLPAAPAGHTYQLWLMAPGNIRPAGLASPKTGTLQAYLDSLDGAAQVGVSVEPSGGSKQPTTTPIMVFDLPT
jgi:anti-sigma-K factor RskA